DEDSPPEPSEYVFAFPIRNKPLLDLLGVRYLVQPADLPPEGAGWRKVAVDPAPLAYCYSSSPVTGGVRRLSPYTVYENADAFPRAFVVTGAGRLPEGRAALAALKAADFRRTVLLEADADEARCPAADGGPRPAAVRDYGPNRVTVGVDDGAAGYLVLADVWFPGWTCTVDGEPAP